MKNTHFILIIILFAACNNGRTNNPLNEKIYLELGGESQYVEIISTSDKNPILLFIHGGPAWPQTPQLRYYNSDLSQKYTLVIWEQRGAGNSYKKNPNPENLNLRQIIQDGHQLTGWLKKKYGQEKMYLAGYSWGSLIGVGLAKRYPEDYEAYIGIAQIINMSRGMQISQKWLKEQAASDSESLKSIDSLNNKANYRDDLDRFFKQWMLLNKFRGATYSMTAEKETEKAMTAYPDYKDYEWFKVWDLSSRKIQGVMFGAQVDTIKSLKLPVFLIQGRHDWNIPSVLAEEWLTQLESSKKKLFWFEKSGHGPLEEEPQKFNEVMMSILKE